MLIPVHSPWLPSYTDVVNDGWIFSGQTLYNKSKINKVENENLVRSLKLKFDSFNRLIITKLPSKLIKKKERSYKDIINIT